MGHAAAMLFGAGLLAALEHGVRRVWSRRVIFNLGYVFHEIVAHDFMVERIGAITRTNYIIPLIALSFVIYVAILVWPD